jgi:uncharacterized protein (DUF1800 family)
MQAADELGHHHFQGPALLHWLEQSDALGSSERLLRKGRIRIEAAHQTLLKLLVYVRVIHAVSRQQRTETGKGYVHSIANAGL